MKNKTLFFVLCLLSTIATTHGQTLILTNGSQEINFKSGGIYEIILAETDRDLEKDCCNYSEYRGSLSKVTEDSLHLQLIQYIEQVMENDRKIAKRIVSDIGNNYGSIARRDIFSIKYYKSQKSKKRKKAFTIVGGMLLFTAAATALNTIIISNKDSRNTLWQSAGIQAGTGILSIALSGSKQYKLKGKEGVWRVK